MYNLSTSLFWKKQFTVRLMIGRHPTFRHAEQCFLKNLLGCPKQGKAKP